MLQNPLASFDIHDERLASARRSLDLTIERLLEAERREISHLAGRARSLSPHSTLQRGYAILSDGSGQTIASIAELDEGDDLMARLADGRAVLEVRHTIIHEGADDD